MSEIVIRIGENVIVWPLELACLVLCGIVGALVFLALVGGWVFARAFLFQQLSV